MSKKYMPVYNSKGELITDDINVIDDRVIVDNQYIGDVQDNRVVVEDTYVGRLVRTRNGFVILDEVAYNKFKKYQEEKKTESKQEKSKLRKVRLTLVISAISLATIASIFFGVKIKKAVDEKERKRIETLQENNTIIIDYFTNLATEGKLTAEQFARVSETIRTIDTMPAEEMDTKLKELGKIILADELNLDISRASFLQIPEPHFEKTDGEWAGDIVYYDQYGTSRTIGNVVNLKGVSRDAAQFIIDASNIKPDKVTDKTRESYTNKLAGMIKQKEEAELDKETEQKGGFGM